MSEIIRRAYANKWKEYFEGRRASYGRDAERLRHEGKTDEALVYEAIRDELRTLPAAFPCLEDEHVEVDETGFCRGCGGQT